MTHLHLYALKRVLQCELSYLLSVDHPFVNIYVTYLKYMIFICNSGTCPTVETRKRSEFPFGSSSDNRQTDDFLAEFPLGKIGRRDLLLDGKQRAFRANHPG